MEDKLRVSDRALYAVLSCFWVGTLAAAYWLGSLGREPEEAPARDFRPESSILHPVFELEQEGEPPEVTALLEEVERLQLTLDERNKALLRTGLDRFLESSVARPEINTPVADLIEAIGGTTPGYFPGSKTDLHLTGNAFYQEKNNAHFDYALVTVELGRRKEQAVPLLVDLILVDMPATDEVSQENYARIEAQREFAFGFLPIVNDVRAFVGLLEYFERLPEGRMPELRYVERHVANLPSDEILPYASRMVRVLHESIEVGTLTWHATQIAGSLVFSHNYSPANSILMNPRSLEERMGNALQQAVDAHTPEARRYLEWLATNHETEGARLQAERVLAEW